MKITKQLLKNKKTIGTMLAFAIAGSLTSCTTDNEDLNLNSESTNEQTAQISDFTPDLSKVYTITSSSGPLTLATNGNGRLLTTVKSEITVEELWRFSPSTTPGSYYIDCLGGRENSRLSTISGTGILSPVANANDSQGLSSSWTITSASGDNYFLTNLGEGLDFSRLTSVGFGFSTIRFGARLTTEDSETSSEEFSITEIDFPSQENRAPSTNVDFLRRDVGSPSTLTASVVDNDFDPDGDALTLTGVSTPDDRISVAIVNNEVQVTFNFSSSIVFSIDVVYTISDGNGGTSQGVLTVFRSAPTSNA